MPSNSTRSLQASGPALFGHKLSGHSLLDTDFLSKNDILELFAAANELESLGEKHGNYFDPSVETSFRSRAAVVCCLFFEPSTRTRMSFQTAAYRLGHQVLTMELFSGSSLSKGETYVDTVLNFAAMQPDIMIVRYGRSPELDELLPTLRIPVINAGSGMMAHPTQGLLDAYTIHREMGGIEGKRVLIVGDILHSRVARSNFDVLSKFGAEVGICGPKDLLPGPSDQESPPCVRHFETLEAGLEWTQVYMGLRIQMERHEVRALNMSSLDDYHRHFGLNRERLQLLAKDAIIMHPGPINHGVEFSSDVTKDPRNRVLKQVRNGVLMRAALLAGILGPPKA